MKIRSQELGNSPWGASDASLDSPWEPPCTPAAGRMRSARSLVLPEAAALPAPPLAGSGGACGGPGEEAGHVGAASAAAAPPPVPAAAATATAAAAAAASWAESARGPSGARFPRPPGLISAVRPLARVPARRPAADMATRSCREKAQKLNEQHQLILSKLLREEDNKYCADCEAKGSARAWWPLGRGLLRP